jgi:acetyltransferase
MSSHYLQSLFNPRSVAVFGASEREESVAGVIYRNLRQPTGQGAQSALGVFGGPVYPVNPKHETLYGEPCYASAAELPQIPDLAIIATPAPTIPALMNDLGRNGIRRALVLSAGFREVGAAGWALENRVLEAAREHGIRFVGPNCLGIQRPSIGLNATFSQGGSLSGDLALVSQSGALCTAMLDWAEANGIGFSSVISSGASADIDFGEILDYLAYDTATKGILMYIEGIRDARRFMSALRATARVKPIVLLKVGRHEAGSKAVQSHTGALVGSDAVFDALVRRAGVVRVQTIEQLFASARALSSHINPRGNRLAIVTNGGGPGVMATDRAVDLGVKLADLSPATVQALNAALPSNWSHGNPVDVIGDAGAERYRKAVEACLSDDGVDGVLVVLTPQTMTRPAEVAEAVIPIVQASTKPVLACWMGENQVMAGRQRFKEAGIPCFTAPEPAVEVFSYLSAFNQNQRLLLQVPGPVSRHALPDVEGALLIVESALAHGRKVLSEVESKALLSAFHIPVAQTLIARDPTEAMLMAQQIGFPVVMKINSQDISHKSDVGGVKLGLANAAAVRSAYAEMMHLIEKRCPEARLEGVVIEPMVIRPHAREIMIGVTSDPVLGPVIAFGAGGVDVEAFQDRAIALPPLNRYLARDLIRRTRASILLGEFRNRPPASMEMVEQILLRVSEMVCELPYLKEMDINPLLVDVNGALAADARIIIQPRAPSGDRYGHMAIHPYPAHLVTQWQTVDGLNIEIRPMRPEDAQGVQAFVRGLSAETRYLRYMQTINELSPAMLVRFTQIDYDREMALIAVSRGEGEEDEERILGVSRYASLPNGDACEFAVVVDDHLRGKGLAHKLMNMLMEIARSKGLRTMEGEVLKANSDMLHLAQSLGFRVETHPDDDAIRRVVRGL